MEGRIFDGVFKRWSHGELAEAGGTLMAFRDSISEDVKGLVVWAYLIERADHATRRKRRAALWQFGKSFKLENLKPLGYRAIVFTSRLLSMDAA